MLVNLTNMQTLYYIHFDNEKYNCILRNGVITNGTCENR